MCPRLLIDHMLFQILCWCLVSEWTLGLVNALNHHWCETRLLPQAILKHVVSREISFSVSLYMGSVLFCSIISYQNFQCYNCFEIISIKLKHVMWVTSGLLCVWVSGSSGSIGVTHGEPCWIMYDLEGNEWKFEHR